MSLKLVWVEMLQYSVDSSQFLLALNWESKTCHDQHSTTDQQLTDSDISIWKYINEVRLIFKGSEIPTSLLRSVTLVPVLASVSMTSEEKEDIQYYVHNWMC